MKYIVRYLLEGDGTIPKFIENGGYLSIGAEHVGVSVDASKLHVPKSVHRLSKKDLLDRITILYKDKAEITLQRFLSDVNYQYE